LPGLEKGQAEPPVYAQERTRFAQELAKARAKIAANIETRSQVGLLNAQRAAQAADYTRIQTEYAGYASSAGTKDVIQDVSKSLTPFRPPTAPASDIEIERKAIASVNNQKLLMIQVALFIAVLVLLSYVLLSTDTAHLVALLLIAVGIATGFFLRK
jgi:sensor c-di-GMP phosphodiesterase-like protein